MHHKWLWAVFPVWPCGCWAAAGAELCCGALSRAAVWDVQSPERAAPAGCGPAARTAAAAPRCSSDHQRGTGLHPEHHPAHPAGRRQTISRFKHVCVQFPCTCDKDTAASTPAAVWPGGGQQQAGCVCRPPAAGSSPAPPAAAETPAPEPPPGRETHTHTLTVEKLCDCILMHSSEHVYFSGCYSSCVQVLGNIFYSCS